MKSTQEEPSYSEFAKRIRKYRNENHLSQEGLAAKLECDTTTIRRWESGRSLPEKKYRKALYNLLSMSGEEFLALINPESEIERDVETLPREGEATDEIPTRETRERIQHTIFARYVERMLKRREQSKRWKPEQVIHWLMFLAKQMQQHDQTVFSVENLQLTWLSRGGRILSQLCVGLLGGLVGGVFIWLISELFFILFLGGLLNGLIVWLVVGLLFGFDAKINPAEVLIWSWKKARSGLVVGLAIGLLSGLAVGLLSGPLSDLFGPLIWLVGGLVVALFFGFDAEIHLAKALTWSWKKALSGLFVWLFVGLIGGTVVGEILGLIGGLIGGLIVGLILGLVLGLSGGQIPERLSFSPNQGIWRSSKNGLVVGLVVGLFVALVGGLFGEPINWLSWGLTGLIINADLLWWGIFVGLFFVFVGLLVWLFFGLDAFVKHFTLRFFLWRRGELPWDLIPFLDEAAGRLLLRKVGGSYIFVHRQLLDYFVTLDEAAST